MWMKVIFRMESFSYFGRMVMKDERASEGIRSFIKKANGSLYPFTPSMETSLVKIC
jgi:hypothetical protein